MSIEGALRTESLATDRTRVDRGHGRSAVVRADVARQLVLVRQRVFTDGTDVLLLARLTRQRLDLKGQRFKTLSAGTFQKTFFLNFIKFPIL